MYCAVISIVMRGWSGEGGQTFGFERLPLRAVGMDGESVARLSAGSRERRVDRRMVFSVVSGPADGRVEGGDGKGEGTRLLRYGNEALVWCLRYLDGG